MFNIIDDSEAVLTKNNPLSTSVINFNEVMTIGLSLYDNPENWLFELNVEFETPQQEWLNEKTIKLRKTLSPSVRNIKKTPQTEHWQNLCPNMSEWYTMAHKKARQFEVDFVDEFYGHCKPEIEMTNESNENHYSYRTLPFQFVSCGKHNGKNMAFLQMGNPQIDPETNEFYVDTFRDVYPIDKRGKDYKKTKTWNKIYDFDFTNKKLERVVC